MSAAIARGIEPGRRQPAGDLSADAQIAAAALRLDAEVQTADLHFTSGASRRSAS